ncbi:MAG: hypothetical protein AAFV96_00515 [Pseudomonadota bacterium]
MVFYSRASARAAFAELGTEAGWWAAAEAGFDAVFRHLGLPWQVLARPEFYPEPSFLPDPPPRWSLGGAGLATLRGRTGGLPWLAEGKPLHLSLRPLPMAAFLKGGVNVSLQPIRDVAAEDFRQNVARPGDLRAGVRHDAGHMARCFDAVWVPSEAAAAALRSHGVHGAEAVPVPLPTVSPSLSGVRVAPMDGVPRPASQRFDAILRQWRRAGGERSARLFLAVFDPDAAPQALAAVLHGFAALAASLPQARLILVPALDAERRQACVPEDLPALLASAVAPFRCPDVWVTLDPLSSDALAGLARAADFVFHLDTAAAQDLPLQLAMAAGAVSVSRSQGCTGQPLLQPGQLAQSGAAALALSPEAFDKARAASMNAVADLSIAASAERLASLGQGSARRLADPMVSEAALPAPLERAPVPTEAPLQVALANVQAFGDAQRASVSASSSASAAEVVATPLDPAPARRDKQSGPTSAGARPKPDPLVGPAATQSAETLPPAPLIVD